MSEGVDKALKLFGELLVPGASLFADGRVKEGGLHLAASFGARMLLGPAGALAIGLNSFARSTTSRHLHEHALEGACDDSGAAKGAAKKAA